MRLFAIAQSGNRELINARFYEMKIWIIEMLIKPFATLNEFGWKAK